jgi:YD repeat-containing protein
MKKYLFTLIVVTALMIGLTGTVFAAGPVEYTIDVRNRTGQSVELNYTGADQIIHTTTIPAGVTSLTLTEGTYGYWADPKCGHISGSMNISQQSSILWISCDASVPALKITKSVGPQSLTTIYQNCDGFAYGYNVYDWNEPYDAWLSYGHFCFDAPAVEGDYYQASVYFDGNAYDYEYYPTGLNPSDGCGFENAGEGFYFTYTPGVHDHCK